MELLHKDLTDKILKIFYDVHYLLGYGFLEKVYQNALCYELEKNNIKFEKERKIEVKYKDIVVGEYYADIIVEDKIILEIKASENIRPEYEYQLINYLKATGIEVGLVLNFGEKAKFSRKVFTNKK